jgi:AP-3 complex subunit beta
LALEPPAIEAVLKELRMYIRSADTKFVCASIRAVGKVVELSRIVYDRHGEKSGHVAEGRKTANRIALDCLYGLTEVTQNCDSSIVVGEAISVMQNILLILMSNTNVAGRHMGVDDPNEAQGFAMRRSLLLLVNSLSSRVKTSVEENEGSDNEEEDKRPSELGKVAMELPPKAAAAALWLVGEWMSNAYHFKIQVSSIDGDAKAKMRLEIIRLVDRAFPELDGVEKQQGIHFASKLLIASACGTTVVAPTEIAISEHILAMGRVDVNPDVKDRARFESAVIQASIGLKHDTGAMEASPALGTALTLDKVKGMLLDKRPAPSFLPVADTVDNIKFRFGTLSSLVGHKARDAYLPLPPWGEKNSAKSLRDATEVAVKTQEVQGAGLPEKTAASTGFYASSGSSSDSSSGSSSSESSNGQNADRESESDDSSTSSDESDDKEGLLSSKPNMLPANGLQDANLLGFTSMSQPSTPHTPVVQSLITVNNSSDGNSSSSDDSDSSSSGSSSSDESSYNGDVSSASLLSKPVAKQGDLLQMGIHPGNIGLSPEMKSNGSAAIDDFRGLVMAPIAVKESAAVDVNSEHDASSWMQLVRPELCGGLAARARYLRGKARSKEVQLAGLDPKDPAIICIQIQFKNK